MRRSETASPPSNPGEATRLAWIFVLLLWPGSGIAYVKIYELDNGGREALVHLSLMLVVSLTISIFAAIKAPLPGLAYLDRETFTRPARWCLFSAIFFTVCFALLLHAPSSQDCHLGVACRTHPLFWLASAGMFYCYSITSYILRLRAA
jgi:hypothetical protein